ncbi:hypothetical protein BJ138DRAFT_1134694 [Hygrophoropsis aurantiaca]|uniref:Uncharacterized protein n=1 Tax=Hygrophoropsis aurantiaca TaxID=72124 RepID=A0ACB8AG88_9AGAM|nr:hypothetical protein BJ138DRAFT_1134694 [Hygrophoropsis aurantiaca]
MFIGAVFMMAIYGILVLQVVSYMSVYRHNDRPWIVSYVLTLFAIVTIKVVFNIQYLYDALIIHFSDSSYLLGANWAPLLTGVISGVVQLFYAWRVHVIVQKKWLTVIIVLLSLIGGLSGIATAVCAIYIPIFTHFQRFKAAVTLWLGFSALSDVIIAALLVWHLQRRKTGFKATDTIVNQIIRLTIQTGAATSVIALLDLIIFLADVGAPIKVLPLHLLFNSLLATLYANSLMASLNARGTWKFVHQDNSADPPSVHMRTSGRPERPSDGTNLRPRPEVFIQVESHEMSDNSDRSIKNSSDLC